MIHILWNVVFFLLFVLIRQEKAGLAQTSPPSPTSWHTGTTCSFRPCSKPMRRYVLHSIVARFLFFAVLTHLFIRLSFHSLLTAVIRSHVNQLSCSFQEQTFWTPLTQRPRGHLRTATLLSVRKTTSIQKSVKYLWFSVTLCLCVIFSKVR